MTLRFSSRIGKKLTLQRLNKMLTACAVLLTLLMLAGCNSSSAGSSVSKDGKRKDVLSKQTEYFTSGAKQITLYNSNGNRIKFTRYASDSDIEYSFSYKYDDNGYLIKRTQTSYGRETWEAYENDNSGNKVITIFCDQDGSLERTLHENVYDKNGKLIKQTDYDSSGITDGWTEWEYDSNGRQIKSAVFNFDGSLFHSEEYEYDSAGNPTKSIITIGDNLPDTTSYTNEYDKTGRIIKSTSDSMGWTEYEYNSNGNVKTATCFNSNGRVFAWIEFQYSSNIS